MTRAKLYWLIALLCTAGYMWVGYHWVGGDAGEAPSIVGSCMIKHTTGVPCPSCGSTRSALLILDGRWSEAFLKNPLGFLAIGLLLILPVILIFDLLKGRETLFKLYLRGETILRKKQWFIPLTALILANWVWNIIKVL